MYISAFVLLFVRHKKENGYASANTGCVSYRGWISGNGRNSLPGGEKLCDESDGCGPARRYAHHADECAAHRRRGYHGGYAHLDQCQHHARSGYDEASSFIISASRVMLTLIEVSISAVISTSPMGGTFVSVVGVSPSRAATIAFVTKFLAPRQRISPITGYPPSIRYTACVCAGISILLFMAYKQQNEGADIHCMSAPWPLALCSLCG